MSTLIRTAPKQRTGEKDFILLTSPLLRDEIPSTVYGKDKAVGYDSLIGDVARVAW